MLIKCAVYFHQRTRNHQQGSFGKLPGNLEHKILQRKNPCVFTKNDVMPKIKYYGQEFLVRSTTCKKIARDTMILLNTAI